MPLRQMQGVPVAGGKRFRFTVRPFLPHGTNAMDDVTGLQLVAARDLRLASTRAAEGTAFREQPRARAPVNGAVDAATAEERLVGGVHDRVDVKQRDVALDDLDHAQLGP